MNEIAKRRGIINIEETIFKAMIDNKYYLWLNLLYKTKIVITSMEPISQGVIEINCISPYFEELDEEEEPIQYELEQLINLQLANI